jgi:large subunit ribosomal protein L24
MKLKVGDQVIVTMGKDKGMKSVVSAVLPVENKVVVKGANYYIKHVKPVPAANRPGERVRLERPLATAKIAIINNLGQPDRVGYEIDSKGNKIRIYKKTGKQIPDNSKKEKEKTQVKTNIKKSSTKSSSRKKTTKKEEKQEK